MSAEQTSAGGPTATSGLKHTPLHDLHVSLGAKMVPFAGYEMPVQYPLGVLKEHLWTREKAGLFDVSHMGQAYLGDWHDSHETVARFLETLVAADIQTLEPGQQRYTQLLADDGGILDDLMVTRPYNIPEDGTLQIVWNAARKNANRAFVEARLPPKIGFLLAHSWASGDEQSLLALQGPQAASVLVNIWPDVADLPFMAGRLFPWMDTMLHVSRAGYTGEDGFEISLRAKHAEEFARKLLAHPLVQPIGLGARDSLRLEAGLCLYGHDIDETTSPIEAGLAWSIQKRRRIEGGFPGAARIQRELKDGPARLRVGIRPEGRAPAREGTEVLSADGKPIGRVTSGGFGPSINGPIAMGYVEAASAAPGTPLQLVVRGKPLPAHVVALPFVQHRYARGLTLRV